MSYNKVNVNENQLQYAFSHTERPYLQALTNKANEILVLIKHNQATKEEKCLFLAIKWSLKQLGAVDKERSNEL